MTNYVSLRRILLPLFRKRVARVTGERYLPVKGPYLIAANHIDYLDWSFISAVVYAATKQPVYFIAKTNNYWWTRMTIPIDPTQRSSSINDAFMYLQSGKIICNFIEGERNPGKRLLRGKSGTARLALLAGVPVIPIGLIGPSSRNFLTSIGNAMSESSNFDVHIGAPVGLDDLIGRAHDQAAVQEATRRIMSALAPLAGKAFA